MENKVLFEVNANGLAQVILNAPKKLNALDTDMLGLIRDQLLLWQTDSSVKAILFRSSLEKAFCAGGDVKSLVLEIETSGMDAAYSFFNTEYFTDYLVYQINKPTIAFCAGITMGGGLGLIQGCQFKVFSDDSLISMPEVSIGLFPDVGASHFLNKSLYGRIAGLTSYRLNSSEAFSMGLCTHVKTRHQMQKLYDLLLNLSWSDNNDENTALIKAKFGKSEEQADAFADNEFFILGTDEIEYYQSDSARVQFAQKAFLEGSPLSRLLIDEQIRRSKSMSLEECFLMEWQLAINCCEKGDFRAGVKAKLIDKNNQPLWLNEVADINSFFTHQEAHQFQNILKKYKAAN